MRKVRKIFCHKQKKVYFCGENITKHMKYFLVLLFAGLPFHSFQVLAAHSNAQTQEDSTRVDTLRQVEVHGDSVLRVNDVIRRSIGRDNDARIGVMSVSDVIGTKASDIILHPFAIKDRKREKKHARDRKILEEYEQLGRIKTFEELLDEAIRQQAIEDGKEPPTRSGKKK